MDLDPARQKEEKENEELGVLREGRRLFREIGSLFSSVPDPQRDPDPQIISITDVDPATSMAFKIPKNLVFSIFFNLTYLRHLDLHDLGIRWKDPDP
jgi:hypothetical protein